MDCTEFVGIIKSVETPLSFLVLVTLIVASLCVYLFKSERSSVKTYVFSGVCVALLAIALFLQLRPHADSPLKIVFMDSYAKEDMYPGVNAAEGETNSHVIREMVNNINGLNAALVIEPTAVNWNYEEILKKMNPDLVVIHYSAFENRTLSLPDRAAKRKFHSFLKSMSRTKSKLFIYTRSTAFDDEKKKVTLFQESGIDQSRISFYKFEFEEGQTLRDPTIERQLKDKVTQALGLDA